jgi:hypothetical protein
MVRTNEGEEIHISVNCGVRSEYMLYRGSTFRYLEETLLGRNKNESIIIIKIVYCDIL